MNAIETEGLVKNFGNFRALDGLTFEVPTGSVFGFLGPNGAGKTTAIRILLGLARASSGTARILGTTMRPGGTESARVGFLPDVPEFYGWMRASEYLAFSADLYGLERRRAQRRAEMLLEMVGLTGVHTTIGGYSRGMKQRLGIAQALLNSPDLLILDEPTSALDPLGRHELLNLISSLRGKTTIFFSTHILSDVEKVCDRVAVVDRGRIVAADTTAGLRARYGGSQRLRVELVANPADMSPLESQAWVQRLEKVGEGWIVDVRDLAAAQREFPALAAAQGWALRRFEVVEASLEDVFVSIVDRSGR